MKRKQVVEITSRFEYQFNGNNHITVEVEKRTKDRIIGKTLINRDKVEVEVKNVGMVRELNVREIKEKIDYHKRLCGELKPREE